MSQTIKTSIVGNKIDMAPFFEHAGTLLRQSFNRTRKQYYIIDIIFEDYHLLSVKYQLRSYATQPEYIVGRSKVLVHSVVEKCLPIRDIGDSRYIYVILNRKFPGGENISREISIEKMR